MTRHGVFSLEEICAFGITASAVRERAAAGRLHRVHRSVYSLLPPPLLTVRGRYRAATLACSGSRHLAALSHRSAADLHGLRECHRTAVEVIVPGRSTHRHAGIEVHRATTLSDVDLVTVDAIAVTTIARTLLDLAAVIPARGLERALDQAEVLGRFDQHALLDQLARNPRHPGAGHLRAWLESGRLGLTITDSALEEVFLAFCRTHEFPLPQFRAAVDPGDGGILLRPDAVWRGARVVVELDCERFHRTRRAFEEDRRRDQRLLAAGWRVIRTTWAQLTRRPRELAETLRRLLG